MRRRIAIVTPEAVDDQMAGPAIRAWNMAEVLSDEHDVHLLSTVSAQRAGQRFQVAFADHPAISVEVAWADVVITHPGVLRTHPAIADASVVVVVDVYDPFHLENLEGEGQPGSVRSDTFAHLNSVISDSLLRGDFFLCASERQRDFWLGSLAALGRINPATYDADPTLRRLIDVAPFGIPSEPPVSTRKVLRGVVPGIGTDDRVLLWGGGVYDWFDPLTLIEAVALVSHEVPDVRLFFLGMAHPNPDLPPMRVATEARLRADELDLTGRHVFFNDGWVPYDERGAYLLEADLGVSTHRLDIETTFAFRTRLLDYLWAGLPVVMSDGDVFAELTKTEGIGISVPPSDPWVLAQAIVSLLGDQSRLDTCIENTRRIAQQFLWPNALRSLMGFCRDPFEAPDRRFRESTIDPTEGASPDDVSTWRRLLRHARGQAGQR